jgi:hypothetical protein
MPFGHSPGEYRFMMCSSKKFMEHKHWNSAALKTLPVGLATVQYPGRSARTQMGSLYPFGCSKTRASKLFPCRILVVVTPVGPTSSMVALQAQTSCLDFTRPWIASSCPWPSDRALQVLQQLSPSAPTSHRQWQQGPSDGAGFGSWSCCQGVRRGLLAGHRVAPMCSSIT